MTYFLSIETAKELHERGCDLDFNLSDEEIYQWEEESGEIIAFPKYDIRDIICDGEMAKKFFGDEFISPPNWYGEGVQQPAYKFHTWFIFDSLQQNKKAEAEAYLLEHCIFTKKS